VVNCSSIGSLLFLYWWGYSEPYSVEAGWGILAHAATGPWPIREIRRAAARFDYCLFGGDFRAAPAHIREERIT
jgi:hypothetical protein